MHTPDTEVLEKALCPSLESMITTAQLRWADHLVRMDDVRLPKRLFYGELASGKRPQHKPRKRNKDGLKSNLKDADIDVDTWELTAVDRDVWRELVKTGCGSLHAKRLGRTKLKRALRKGSPENLPCDHANWIWETCRRVRLSKAGYVNHIDRPSSSSVPQRPDSTMCVISGKVRRFASGLKRHMVVHKDNIFHAHPINPVKTLTFVCHVCHCPCKSAAGVQSHLRTNEGLFDAEHET